MKYLFISIIALTVIVKLFGYFFTITTSGSLPNGLYIKVNKEPEVGDIVLFCPPNNEIIKTGHERLYIKSGFCPGGYRHMLKKILAAKINDQLLITAEGIYLNGLLVENTALLASDSQGRPLEILSPSYSLNHNEFFAYSDFNQNSFDGRYFGTVDKNQIIKVVRPLYTEQ